MHYPCAGHLSRAGRVYGPVQTSTRAELRAIADVLVGAQVPTTVVSDCLYVVNACQALLCGGEVAPDWPDIDLWHIVQGCIRARPSHAFQCRWMPSHLKDDEGKRRKYADMLACGDLSEADIVANDAADALALQGSDLHKLPPGVMWALVDARHVTMMTQGLILGIWKRFEAPDEAAALYPDDDFEMHELERVMHEQRYAEDADAFGLVDMDGHDVVLSDGPINGDVTCPSASAVEAGEALLIAGVSDDDSSDFRVQVASSPLRLPLRSTMTSPNCADAAFPLSFGRCSSPGWSSSSGRCLRVTTRLLSAAVRAPGRS